MRQANDLRNELRRIDRRGYGAYKDLKGAYGFPDYVLHIDRVQSDPFAPPSEARVVVEQARARLPRELFSTKSRRTGLEDYLTRAFGAACGRVRKGRRGSGKSGLIEMLPCGQEILERTSVEVSERVVEARFFIGLPAFGRTIAGAEAERMLLDEVPEIVGQSLFYGSLDGHAARCHVEMADDADFLRACLREQGLVTFVADGAVLPRESGVSDRPLGDTAVPFASPPSLRVNFDLPNRGGVAGMAIPQGITLIVGGGYHGKSTLLDAISLGVYNHIPGDGRELAVTCADAAKIRAEDGRSISEVDISPFISNLPFGQDTSAFTTPNASGSTSQAANIIEALEAGSRLLLIDEDTSATNFMIRDKRMQELVAKDKEPITPLIDTVRLLEQDLGVSTILVMGGSGDYFDVADRVIMLDSYHVTDVTPEAKRIAGAYASQRREESAKRFTDLRPRMPVAASFDPYRGRTVKIRPRGTRGIDFGTEHIDLSALEQLVDPAQSRAIGWLIHHAAQYIFDGETTLTQGLDRLNELLDARGLLAAVPGKSGDYARPRRWEIAGAINRLRTLRCAAG
ncbi:MAG: ABC-ATPase domain-containing protein [Armatimonadota bacterium]|nr:MAG: ABC-ATPase domain-containing protein [Armatimonadota bacterium]